ncbi:phosphotransferase [Jatrophihabitans sp.]|uniref:phosphotransferase n=1 Tax=Jatrophihabitans sp. TaxID=1932789 RepID=UPI002CC3E597|nr:phosphotransferase [Jatrophihabitans sp.]
MTVGPAAAPALAASPPPAPDPAAPDPAQGRPAGDEHELLMREFLAAHRHLGQYVSVQPNGYAFLNAVWLLHTDRGGFVVKRHVPEVGAERLEWTAQLLDALHEQGFPNDRILRTDDGAAALALHGRMFTAHTFLPGECFRGGMARLTEAQRTSAVDGLAWFHSLAGQLRGAGAPPALAPGAGPDSAVDPGPLLYCEDVSELAAYCTPAVEQLAPGYRAELDDLLGHLAEVLRGEAYRALDRQIIHGDYRHKNMVFSGEEFAGLFDWDFVQLAPRLVDVCGRFAQHYLDVSATAGPDAIAGYLARYREAALRHSAPLSREEELTLPDLLRAGVVSTGVVVAAFLCHAPLMAAETAEDRTAEARRRLLRARAQLRTIDEFWPRRTTPYRP